MAQYGSALVNDQRRTPHRLGGPGSTSGCRPHSCVVAAVGAAVIVGNFVGAASQPIGWAVACAVVAALLRPLAGSLRSPPPPRSWPIILTLLTVVLLLGGAWVGVLNTIADNVATLKRDAPAAAADIELDNEAARDFKLEERVTAFVEDLDEQAGTTAQLRQSTSTLSTYVVTGVLVLFFIGYGHRLVDGASSQLDDETGGNGRSSIGAQARAELAGLRLRRAGPDDRRHHHLLGRALGASTCRRRSCWP